MMAKLFEGRPCAEETEGVNMDVKKATLVGVIGKSCIADLKVKDVVTFEEEPTNTSDKNAIKVIFEGNDAGYLGQNIVLDNTDDVATVKSYISRVKEGTVESLGESEANPRVWVGVISMTLDQVKEEVEKPKAKAKPKTKGNGKPKKRDIVELEIAGVSVVYHHRVDFLGNYDEKKKEKVLLSLDGELVVCLTGGEAIGHVKKDSDRMDDLLEVLGTKDVLGEISRVDGNEIFVKVNLSDTSSEFDEQIAALIKKGFTESDIWDRTAYMKKAKVSTENISQVLGQMRDYPEDLKNRIRKPETLFIDYGDYVSQAIEDLNAGSYLKMVGNKACGKNTLTETLAWLYHRPLFELPGNESTDKTDLEGSPKLETNEDGELNTPYEASAVIQALESGGFLVIDEVNMIRAGALAVLNGLDGRKRLEISGYGRVEVDPGARVMLTMNEGYVATMPLNEATSDRFEPIVFEDPDTIEPLLKGLFPEAPADMISTCQNVYRALQDLSKEGVISTYAVSIRGMRSAMEVALKNKKGIAKYLHRKIGGRGQDPTERIVIRDVIKDITGE